MAHRAGRRVYAFECLAQAYAELLPILRPLHPNITLVHACAGEHTRIGELHLAFDSSSMHAENAERAPMHSAERQKARRDASQEGTKVQAVLVQPLDGLFPAPNAGNGTRTDPIALLKVDTQGSELSVLRGVQQLLARDRPVILHEDVRYYKPLARWFKRDAGDTKAFLAPLGYGCVRAGQVDALCAVDPDGAEGVQRKMRAIDACRGKRLYSL